MLDEKAIMERLKQTRTKLETRFQELERILIQDVPIHEHENKNGSHDLNRSKIEDQAGKAINGLNHDARLMELESHNNDLEVMVESLKKNLEDREQLFLKSQTNDPSQSETQNKLLDKIKELETKLKNTESMIQQYEQELHSKTSQIKEQHALLLEIRNRRQQQSKPQDSAASMDPSKGSPDLAQLRKKMEQSEARRQRNAQFLKKWRHSHQELKKGQDDPKLHEACKKKIENLLHDLDVALEHIAYIEK